MRRIATMSALAAAHLLAARLARHPNHRDTGRHPDAACAAAHHSLPRSGALLGSRRQMPRSWGVSPLGYLCVSTRAAATSVCDGAPAGRMGRTPDRAAGARFVASAAEAAERKLERRRTA